MGPNFLGRQLLSRRAFRLAAATVVLLFCAWQLASAQQPNPKITPDSAQVPAGNSTDAMVVSDDGGRGSYLGSSKVPEVGISFDPPSAGSGRKTTQWESNMKVSTSPQAEQKTHPILIQLFNSGGRLLGEQTWRLTVTAPAPSPSPTSTSTAGPSGPTTPSPGTTSNSSPTPTPELSVPAGASPGASPHLATPDSPEPVKKTDVLAANEKFEKAIEEEKSDFVLAINDPTGISTDPAVVLTNGLLALLLTLVVVAPGILFESTLEANLAEVKGWFGWAAAPASRSKKWLRKLSRSWLGFGLISFFTAILYAFLSPDVSFDKATVALVLGIVVSIVVVTFIKEFIIGAYVQSRGEKKAYLRVLPVTVIVGVICVAISRVTEFEPGYLWVLVAVAAFRGEVGKVQGKAVAIASTALLLVSIGAWVALIPMRNIAGTSEIPLHLAALEAILAATFVAGLEGLVFSLFPMRFLDGHKVIGWSRLAWAALFAVSLFVSFHVLLNPRSGYFGFSREIPALLVIALFAGFSLFSLAFWSYFRFRPSRT